MKYIIAPSAFLLALLLPGCRQDGTTIQSVIQEIERAGEPQLSLAEPPPHGDSDLLTLIRQRLPQLKNGMSTDEVFEFLYLNSKFDGIVTSEGSRDDFTFFYELDGRHELVLSFDYTRKKSGELKTYQLQEQKS